MPYTSVFGNQPVYSANPLLLSLALTANVVLSWPLETSVGSSVLATLMDVTPDAPGRTVTLPDARQGSPGSAITFSNLGASTYTVLNNIGATVLTVASGESWTIYLRSNLVQAGVWRAFQQGSGVSTANAAGLAGAGLKAISTTLNTKFQVSAKGVNYVAVDGDRATILEWTAGVGSFTLPDPTAVGSDWYVGVKNAGTGSLTMTPFGATLIDGSGSLILSTGESSFFFTDGVNFFTIGRGRSINSVFDFISINIAGTGDYILTGAQLNRVAYRFTGILTGNRAVVVPASVQQYWVDNETTGAFTFTVKAAGGDPGKTLAQNNRNIFLCDGTNVLDAVSSAFTPPLAVASGGTGATTAVGARTALGSSAVGDAIFISGSAAAARLALGSTTVGDALFITASVAAARAALGEYYAYKTTNETRTSTVTLANDAELVIANLPINKAFSFEAFIGWTQQGSTANGIQVVPVITGGGLTAMLNWEAYMTTNLAVGNAAPTATTMSYSGQATQTLAAGGTTGQIMKISGICTTGAALGTLAIQWAQAASNATGTRIFFGSWLRVTQLN